MEPDAEDRRRAFGQALRRALARRQMSQAELGRLIGKSSNSINEYCTGRKEPAALVVFDMERTLGCQPGELSIELGYLPPEGAVSIEAAVRATPGLSDRERAAVLGFLREFLKPRDHGAAADHPLDPG